jgi:hypothetical protein
MHLLDWLIIIVPLIIILAVGIVTQRHPHQPGRVIDPFVTESREFQSRNHRVRSLKNKRSAESKKPRSLEVLLTLFPNSVHSVSMP